MDYALIHNPKAAGGRGKKWMARAVEKLKQHGLEHSVHETSWPGHAIELASELSKDLRVHIVIRTPWGAGGSYAAHHSSSYEAWFMHVNPFPY